MAKSRKPSKSQSTQRMINTILVVAVLLVLAYIYYKYQASANVVWGD